MSQHCLGGISSALFISGKEVEAQRAQFIKDSQITCNAAPTLAPGDYVLETDDMSGTVNIKSAAATSVVYTLAVFDKTVEPGPFASLLGRTAKRSGAAFNDAMDDDCQVSFQSAASDTITVTVTGPCAEHGLAAFAKGSGSYKKGDTHGCDVGTTHDSGSARCAGSGGQNDPADNKCSPGRTFDPDAARCAGAGGKNDPLPANH
jgi:hypothetical protein